MNLVRLPTRVRRAAAPVPSRARPHPPPRPVPWCVVRRADGFVEVEHRGEGPLHSVRFALAGSGVLGLSLPRTMLPGERVRARVKEVRDRSRAMLVLRWFEPDGTELLWPIAL